MSNLVVCQSIAKSFGAQVLFNDINLVVSEGDRIGIVGPNGSGKSTLLKIICGLEEQDRGEVLLKKHARLSYLAQADTFDDSRSISDNLLAALHAEDLEEIEKFNMVLALLSRAEFEDPETPVGRLSGGWRKRLAICRALLVAPDILVMDEPTNHLDIEGILWLEKMLSGRSGGLKTFLLVSHDRHFLENCTNRVVELSSVYPEGLFQVKGNYSRFLQERDHFLAGQLREEERLANRMRHETEWLRRGPKARSTKARYRINEAGRLQEKLSDVRARNRASSQVQIDFEVTGRKTRKLLTATAVSKSFPGKKLFSGVDITLSPGTKIGLLGRNGCGKSTLMQILARAAGQGETAVDSGEIKVADNVQLVSFEQDRRGMNPETSLRRALAPDGDSIVYRGRSLHVVSWARKFLFRMDQLETPVGRLSGGEQARILIADIMRRPADILLLDEPTNDLDIASLDVLERSLLDFPGALVLVTHDRFLLDRVCDRILGFTGNGRVAWYADYSQWLADMASSRKIPERKKGGGAARGKSPARKKGRLSYLDGREYDQMEERIIKLEEQVEALERKMTLPEIVSDSVQLAACWQELETTREEVEKLYNRWDELEALKNSG
ncbi:ABC-F family ATP-binding cassette domain-containing protein [Desulfomarina sp.]